MTFSSREVPTLPLRALGCPGPVCHGPGGRKRFYLNNGGLYGATLETISGCLRPSWNHLGASLALQRLATPRPGPGEGVEGSFKWKRKPPWARATPTANGGLQFIFGSCGDALQVALQRQGEATASWAMSAAVAVSNERIGAI